VRQGDEAVRITFAVAMMMVALSSSPFIHKKPSTPAPAAPQVEEPVLSPVPPQTAAPLHNALPNEPHSTGATKHLRRHMPVAYLVRG
jgi:hypothetical protein